MATINKFNRKLASLWKFGDLSIMGRRRIDLLREIASDAVFVFLILLPICIGWFAIVTSIVMCILLNLL